MSTTAGPAGAGAAGAGTTAATDRLHVSRGMVVQELGWDNDVDQELRVDFEDAADTELVEEAVDAVDVVLLWWREADGDVVDGLFDALRDLSDTGFVWLLTPKVGREGHVDPTDIAEAATTAGLNLTTPATLSQEWAASKLVRPRGARR